jgi:hypothetical protein
VRFSHPSAYYVFYLLAQRRFRIKSRVLEEGSSKHLLQKMEEDGIAMPTKRNGLDLLWIELDKMSDLMKVPSTMRSKSLTLEARAFLKRWRIYDIWVGTKPAKAARRVFDSPALRRSVEVMLLGPMQRKDIARYLAKRWGLSAEDMNTGVIRLYEHYYWNVDRLSRAEWDDFIRGHMQWPFNDYLQALNAPRDDGGLAITLNVADRGGASELSPVDMYSTFRDQIFSTFMHHANNGKPGFNNTMAMAASVKTVIDLDEQIERLRGGSVEVLEQFDRIEEAYDPHKPITVRALPVDRPVGPEEIIDTEGT